MTLSSAARKTAGSLELTSKALFRDTRGGNMIFAPHHKSVANALTRVVAGKTKRLIINIPPRSGKTLLVSQMFPAWVMGLNPESQFILTSYSKTLAATNTYSIREVMRSGMYQHLFGANGAQVADDSSARDQFRTVRGGQMYAVGTGGTITGIGAGSMQGGGASGAIIIDDAQKPDEANSDTIRQNVIEWYQQTLQSRVNSPSTPIVLVCQRLHESDLAGWLLDGGSGEEWELLKVPARNESGDSFWPDKFPEEMLTRLERANPYVFAGQYMQEPTPKGGGDFQPDKIEMVDALPAGLRFVRGWDFAASTAKTSDYTATVKLAVQNGIVYIAHIERGHWRPDTVESKLVQIASLDGRDTLTSFPQDPGAAGKAQAQRFSRLLQGHRFESTPESGDKRTRAGGIASQVNAGNVRMLNQDGAREFLHELSAFPMGQNDDFVDSFSRAYNRAVDQKIDRPLPVSFSM